MAIYEVEFITLDLPNTSQVNYFMIKIIKELFIHKKNFIIEKEILTFDTLIAN